jgi:DNA-directed RNA polymerase specialized sigma24 family protein
LPLARAVGHRWARGDDKEDLAQEAALALWKILRERLDAPASLLQIVADHAARDALRRGKSIDRPLPRERERTWRVVSLDALIEDKVGWQAIEGSLMRHRRHGELPNPTEETALARVLYCDLCDRLTSQQRQVLELQLQGYSRKGIETKLGLSHTWVNTIINSIRDKAQSLWEERPAYATVTEAARELGMDLKTIKYYCQRGMLEALREQGHWLICRPLRLRDSRDPAVATVAEVARELHLNRSTVAKFCLQGKIEGVYRQGCQWRIPRPIRLKKYRHDGYAGHKKLPGN